MTWGAAMLLRLVALAAGLFFIYCEADGTYEFLLSQQPRHAIDFVVMAGTGFAVALGLLPMYAGHAFKHGQWGIAIACWLAVPIVMAVVYTQPSSARAAALIRRRSSGCAQLAPARLQRGPSRRQQNPGKTRVTPARLNAQRDAGANAPMRNPSAMRRGPQSCRPGPSSPRRSVPTFRLPERPKLVTSSPEGAGSIPKMLHELLEPGGKRVEIKDCHDSYAARCRAEGKRAVSPLQFIDPVKEFCRRAGIKTKTVGDRFYLLGVQLAPLRGREIS